MFHLVANFLRQEGWEGWSVAQIETTILVWWIFRPGAATPEMIGKLPRTPQYVEIARREAAALGSLAEVAGRLNIPRVLFQADLQDGRFLFVQSGLEGRPLAAKADHFDRLLPWLDAFQRSAPAVGTVADAFRRAIDVCRPQLADATPAERQLLLQAESESARLAALPACAVHGDFWSGNLLDDAGLLGVVDWSNYHSGGPLEDLHNFAAAQGCEHRGGTEQRMRSMWRVFFGGVPLMSRTAEATAQMLALRHIDRDMLRPLFLLFLISRMGHVEFSNRAAWRQFGAHYLEAGMPEPFTVTG